MAGTFPSTPAPAAITPRSIQPTLVSVAHSLVRQARSLGAQRWAFRLRYPTLSQAQIAPLWAFLVAQRGQFETFQFSLPSRMWPLRGSGGGTPRVDDAGGSPVPNQTGDRTIFTDGWPLSITGVVKAGDWVKFGGHPKCYLATEDANSNGSGQATITLEPGLVADPADNDLVYVGNVPFTVALASDVTEFDARPRAGSAGGLFNIEVDIVEAP